MTNLVANAIKFTDKGRISVTIDSLGVDEKQASMRLAVRDEGIGVPQEAQSRIFELFTQADGAVTRRYGGTGLGLAIVKHILARHRGKLTITSRVNHGSYFVATVPLQQKPKP